MLITQEEIAHLAQDLSQSLELGLIKDVLESVASLSLETAYFELSKSCADKTILHPDWGLLGGRIQIHGLRQQIKTSFTGAVKSYPEIYYKDYVDFVLENETDLEEMLVPERDMMFDTFGYSTLFKSYLLRKYEPTGQNQTPVYLETPQYMYLRIATYLWFPNLKKIKQCYDRLSMGEYSHASPTAYNAGTYRPQLSSCFLMSIDDSMEGLSKSWRDCAIISKNTGGLGCDYGSIRHSNIGYFGKSKGIISWLKIKQEILRSVDQGGRRKGSGTMYIPPWHIDIEEFLDLRKNTGPDEMRARDLFQALWVSDLFMKRVRDDGNWSLFCPKHAPGLSGAWGDEFERLYTQYEAEGKYSRQVKAQEVWKKIVLTQKETGMPFMLYKDACNRKSNQQNLGTIKCSNLCVEIVEYTSKKEIASCNLAAVVLPKCVTREPDGKNVFDFEKLATLTKELVENLNQTIDRNYYPQGIPEIPYANLKNRPIGIGVQGLADTFAHLDVAWESDVARRLNKQIFEVMYFSALKQSVELAKLLGPYPSFQGSPSSSGLFQFDLWRQERRGPSLDESLLLPERDRTSEHLYFSNEEWSSLRREMIEYGLRNSLLIALMPTASTAQILRNNEAFEPFSQVIYMRSVLSGSFVIVNRHLVADLEAVGMWSTATAQNILRKNGSLSGLVALPDADDATRSRIKFLKEKYKTAYEISQKTLLQMAIDRGEYVDQSQSFNAWFGPTVTYQQITSFHFYGWENGMKTGMYYLRQPALANPINYALDSVDIAKTKTCPITTADACDLCSA